MQPSDINTYARSKYNATGDTFFSDTEIFYYIYQAELELCAIAPLLFASQNFYRTTSIFSSGANSITLTSATGWAIGNPITDITTSGNFQAGTTVSNLVGAVATLSLPTIGNSTTYGDIVTNAPRTSQGQKIYSFPTNATIIKRIEYTQTAGGTFKMEPITFRENDALTLVNVSNVTQGTPQFYTQFNNYLYFNPVPANATDTYSIYYFVQPVPVTSGTQVLELPSLFHMELVDFVVKEMHGKDKDPVMYQLFDQKWEASKVRALKWAAKQKRGDAFSIVMNEDNLAVTLTGPV